MIKFITVLDDVLEKLSRWGLVLSLFVILGLAVLAIVLRWVGHSMMWIEPLIRHMVFLSAFLGGSLATSKNVHIKIDILTHVLDKSKSRLLKWFHKNIITLFCFITTIYLMKSGYDFFKVEREYGQAAFLDIHSAWLVGIIPAGMGLIAFRYFNQLIIGVLNGGSSEHHRL